MLRGNARFSRRSSTSATKPDVNKHVCKQFINTPVCKQRRALAEVVNKRKQTFVWLFTNSVYNSFM